MSEQQVFDPHAVDNVFGEDGGTGQPRVLLPAGFYPCQLSVAKLEPSREKQTPGLHLDIYITDGPYKGERLESRNSVIWLTPGSPEKKGSMFSLLRHMTHQVTGLPTDGTFMQPFGIHGGMDEAQALVAVKVGFAALDTETKLNFVNGYFRCQQWDGKKCIVSLGIEHRNATNDDGSPKVDRAGNQIIYSNNRVSNFYNMKHDTYGLAQWKRNELPKQIALAKEEGIIK